jgi:Tol biopolymer transport system component
MFISSHNEEIKEKAQFWNVRLEKPAVEGIDGYQSKSKSRLEILDVETGLRNVVFETDSHIEAPNWSRNGKCLIYNSDGKVYKFKLKKGKPKLINTGGITACNNDHGISFDGQMLAISSNTEDEGKRHSIIYTVPLKGGIPKRITENGPSYWHGWSPDGKWLTYCAERNGNYDVYKIPSDGGQEIRLTTAEGLDDGPEYSPDGRFIYFNSVRSGMMQIWRMKPDGSNQEQVTFDNFQNWFAHPSPDGKQLIMISYPPDVPAGSHPHNKRVMLRAMPVNGKEIETAAFLYGGQGTLNVPSWSPDSKKVAFVSYTY